MSADAYDTDRGLRYLIDTGRMSPDALSAITGIPAQSVREYLAAEHLPGMVAAPTELPHTQTAQLAMLSVPLTEGLGEDEFGFEHWLKRSLFTTN